MDIWIEIGRREIDGYTVKISKTWEDMSVRDMYDEESEFFLKEIEDKIADCELDWFQLRVQATKRDYVLGETYCGGFLYVDAKDVLDSDSVIDMTYDAIANAVVESKILKELL